MRIGIDASWACGKRTGTGNYTLDLVESLTEEDHSNEYFLYFRDCCITSNPLYNINQANVTKVLVNSRSTLFRILVPLSKTLKKDKIDVFLSPAYFMPLYGSRKWVVTFFDLNIYLLSKEWIRSGKILDYLMMRILLPWSIQKADYIITISESTQKDLIKIFPITKNKSTIIYPGYHTKMYETSSCLSKKENSDDSMHPYFLSVGVLSPTKNLERSIRAFHKFNEISKIKYFFILAGRNDGKYLEKVLNPLVKNLKIERFVKFYGFVPDEELGDLYKKAFCLLFPSLREGFGYPILEAMYFGIPVITSNVSSCPEVAGDAALYVDPFSEEELYQAMIKVTDDKKLREDIIKRGRKRHIEFSLKAMANKYLTLLDSVSRISYVADN